MIWHLLDLAGIAVVLGFQVCTFLLARWLKLTFLPYMASTVDEHPDRPPEYPTPRRREEAKQRLEAELKRRAALLWAAQHEPEQ